MSRHSKWHNIQVRKGKQDAKKSGVFTKCARAITIAAQEGGADSDMNFSLRLAIERAKAVGMPKDNIERAIKRGTGELKGGVVLTELRYEGFGPGGVAFLVEALTDNVNRTAADVKQIFSKYGGSLGSPGSVQWQFNRRGVVRINNEPASAKASAGKQTPSNKSDFELALIDAGADDIIEAEEGVEIRCPVEKFQKVLEVVKSFLSDAGLPAEALAEAGLEWIPKDMIELDETKSGEVATLYDALDELDDVRAVYTNEA